MKTLLLLILLSVNSYSQEYVTPEELEEGWGFGYSYPLETNDALAGRVITFFNIAGNEEFLYLEYQSVLGDPVYKKTLFYDLKNKTIANYNWKYIAKYSKNGEYSIYYDKVNNFINISRLSVEYLFDCNEFKNCDLSSLNSCYIGSQIISNEEGYFTYLTFKNENGKVDIYRVNLDSLLENNCPSYELIKKTDITKDSLVFTKNSVEYFILPISNYLIPSGFDLYKDYNYVSSVSIPKKISWYVSVRYDTFHDVLYKFNRFNNIKLGENGDVYVYTSFRSESEPNTSNSGYKPENHPEAKEARDASGIYRIDTNGHNPVQLVRSWTNHPGGLQISGDGETIYYAYILPDSTSAIMKMDRYGKNKEIVFKLDPAVLSIKTQTPKPKIYPNPASEYVTISGIGNGKAIIYNSIGQKLIEQDITSTSEINISNLQSGIYIIKLENAGNITFEKLMVGR